MSLEAVAGQLAEQKEDNKKNTDSIVNVMDNVAMRTGRNENTLMTIFSDVRKMRNAITRKTRNPDELEEARENSAYQNELLAVMQGIKDQLANNQKQEEKEEKKDDDGPSFLGQKLKALAVTAGIFAGAIAGYLSPIMTLSKLIGSAVKSLALTMKRVGGIVSENRVIKFLMKPFTGLGNAIMSVGRAVKNIAASIYGISRFFINMGMDALGRKAKDAMTVMKGWATSAKAMFTRFGKTIGLIGSYTDDAARGADMVKDVLKNNPVGKALGKVKTFFSSLGTTLKGMAGIFKPVMQFAKFLSTPILAIGVTIKSLFDNFSTALAMFKDGDILGGIGFLVKGVIDDLINFFVVDLLDMIKGAFAWIAGKLGFDGIAESLNSFSFGEMYQSVSDGIAGFIGGVVEWIKGMLTNFYGGIWEGLKMLFSGDVLGGISKIFSSMFSPITDTFDMIVAKAKEMFNFSNIYDMLTGKKSFSFADIFNAADVNSGAELESTPTADKPTSGQSVRKEVTESRHTKTVNGVVVQDSSQRVVKNTSNGHTSVSMQWSEMDGHDPTIGLRT